MLSLVLYIKIYDKVNILGRPTQQYFNMDEISYNRLVNPTVRVELTGQPKLVDGKFGRAVNLDGNGQYMTMDRQSNNCLGNLDLCHPRCPHVLVDSPRSAARWDGLVLDRDQRTDRALRGWTAQGDRENIIARVDGADGQGSSGPVAVRRGGMGPGAGWPGAVSRRAACGTVSAISASQLHRV